MPRLDRSRLTALGRGDYMMPSPVAESPMREAAETAEEEARPRRLSQMLDVAESKANGTVIGHAGAITDEPEEMVGHTPMPEPQVEAPKKVEEEVPPPPMPEPAPAVEVSPPMPEPTPSEGIVAPRMPEPEPSVPVPPSMPEPAPSAPFLAAAPPMSETQPVSEYKTPLAEFPFLSPPPYANGDTSQNGSVNGHALSGQTTPRPHVLPGFSHPNGHEHHSTITAKIIPDVAAQPIDAQPVIVMPQ
jgi:hypothetical protein